MADVTPDQLQAVERSAGVTAYPAGAVLFEENDPGSRMYVVKKGRVKIWRTLDDVEVVLAHIGPGDFFGEMAILEGLPRSATATIVDAAELIEIDKPTFEMMLRTNGEIALRMMRRLSERLRDADRRLQNALVESGLGRMLEVLRWLASKGEAPSGGWVRLPVKDAPDVFARAGIMVSQQRETEERLKKAQVFRRFEGDIFVAEPTTLDEFGEFLHLHQIYDPLIAKELSEVKDLPNEHLARLVKRVLVSKLATVDGVVSDPASSRVIEQYERYLRLKERFG